MRICLLLLLVGCGTLPDHAKLELGGKVIHFDSTGHEEDEEILKAKLEECEKIHDHAEDRIKKEPKEEPKEEKKSFWSLEGILE